MTAADPGSGSSDGEEHGLQGRLILRRLKVGDPGQFRRPLPVQPVPWPGCLTVFLPSQGFLGELWFAAPGYNNSADSLKLGYLFHAPGIFLSEHFILSSVSCHSGVEPGESSLQEEASRFRSLALFGWCLLFAAHGGEGWWLFSVALDMGFCQERTAGT